jgi:hypothetical protein
MTQRVEDEILVKAKQLAKDDGRLWLWGPDGRDNERGDQARFADDSLKTEYLSRARQLLRQGKG